MYKQIRFLKFHLSHILFRHFYAKILNGSSLYRRYSWGYPTKDEISDTTCAAIILTFIVSCSSNIIDFFAKPFNLSFKSDLKVLSQTQSYFKKCRLKSHPFWITLLVTCWEFISFLLSLLVCLVLRALAHVSTKAKTLEVELRQGPGEWINHILDPF